MWKWKKRQETHATPPPADVESLTYIFLSSRSRSPPYAFRQNETERIFSPLSKSQQAIKSCTMSKPRPNLKSRVWCNCYNLCKRNCSVYIQCKGDIVVVDIKQHKSQFKISNITITQCQKNFADCVMVKFEFFLKKWKKFPGPSRRTYSHCVSAIYFSEEA